MRDKNNGAPLSCYVLHLPKTFFLEGGVADSQHFVNQQDLRLKVRGHCKSEAHVHSRRVALDWRVNETLDLCESDDLVEFTRDLTPSHAQYRRVQKGILSPRQLRVKSR